MKIDKSRINLISRFLKFKILKFRPLVTGSKTIKKIFFLGIILMFALLQITLIDSFKIFNVKPDFILMLAVIASFIFEFKEAVVLSIFAGLLKDVFGVGVFGINTLLFPLWSFLIAKLNRQISIDNNLFRVIIIFVITLLHNILNGLILVYLGRNVALGIFLRIVSLESIYTTLTLPWVFKLMERLFTVTEATP